MTSTAPPAEQPACPLCTGRDAEPFLDGLRDLLASKPGEFALVRCRACALTFLSPRPVREGIGFYYAGVYAESAEKLQTGFLAGLADRARLRDLRSRIAIRAGDRHLEVGSGFGAFVVRLCRATGASAVAIDFGAPQVASVRRRSAAAGVTIDARQGELAAMDLPASSFRSASLLHYLEHGYDPLSDLRTVHRVLADDGAVVIEVPSADAFGLSAFGRFWAAHLAPQHLTTWSHATLDRALRDSGFRDVRVRDGYLPFLLLLSFLQWWHWNLGGASKRNVVVSTALSVLFFVLFGIPLAFLDLVAGPLLALAGRGEVLRATARR